MKNRYLSGVISGMLCTLLVCSVVFGIIYYNGNGNTVGKENTNQTVTVTPSGTDTSTEDGSVSPEVFQKKINTIKNLVNQAFLYDVTEKDYQEYMLKGLMEALDDPYSCYYTKEEYASVMESTNGVYCGIGAVVSQNRNTGVITVVKPYVDGPAYTAGILPGDIIYKVNNEEVTGIDLTTVVTNMKGEKGTDVTISVYRENETEPRDYVVTRDEIEIQTVEYEMLADNIGYIAISQFDKVTVEQYRSAISDLIDQGMVGLIIDLRDNGGGLYTSAVSMLDRLINDGLLVYTETKSGERDEEYATKKESFKLPLAVLVNGNSASASEIFAGAVQDHGIGTIVGTQSFGKGIVQSLIPLTDGSAVKITISNYYTPSGRSIHGVGITPDVVVDLDDALKSQVVIKHEEDNQLQKAIEVIKEKCK